MKDENEKRALNEFGELMETKNRTNRNRHKYCRDCKKHDGYLCLKTGKLRAGGCVACNDRENRE